MTKKFAFRGVAQQLMLCCMTIAFTVGFFACSTIVVRDYIEQENANTRELQSLLKMQNEAIAEALQSNDTAQARRTLTDFDQMPFIMSGEILRRDGSVLARVENEPYESKHTFLTRFIGNPIVTGETKIRTDGAAEPLGSLRLNVSRAYLFEGFMFRFQLRLVTLLASVVLTGFLLVFLLKGLFMRPLHRFTKELAKIDPQNPKSSEMLGEMSERRDEFGVLARTTQSLIQESQSNLHERQRATDRLKDFSRSASDWFWECDSSGVVTDISPRFFETLKFSRMQVIGSTVEDFLQKHARAEIDWQGWKSQYWVERLAFRNLAIDFLCPDGEHRRVEVSGVPVFDAQWDFKGYRGVGTDLTELAQAHDEGRKLRDQLRHSERLNAIGQLTGGVAHDFNNILSTVIGNLEFIISQGEMKGYEEDLELCVHAAERGASLTNRLLAFSRQQQLSPVAVRANSILPEIQEFLKRTIGEHIALKIELKTDITPCYADKQQLESALINLVINARDAIKDRGEIYLRAYEKTVKNAQVFGYSDLQPGSYICFEVEDNGCGISSENLSRVFEPFFSTKSHGKGSGLGLSMVYGFAAQSNGFLDIDSKEQQGTTVRLYLPKVEAALAVKQSTPSTPNCDPILTGKKILVVEDDRAVKITLSKLLDQLGCEVNAVEDEDAARDAVEAEKSYDLLLFDVMLKGGYTGPELVKNLRESYDLRAPCIFMSGYSKTQVMQSRFEIEDCQFLNKPFTLEHLRAALTRAFANDTSNAPYKTAMSC